MVEVLGSGPTNTTRIAKQIAVDDGELTVRLGEMATAGVIAICGADGATPIWELTTSGRERLEQLRP